MRFVLVTRDMKSSRDLFESSSWDERPRQGETLERVAAKTAPFVIQQFLSENVPHRFRFPTQGNLQLLYSDSCMYAHQQGSHACSIRVLRMWWTKSSQSRLPVGHGGARNVAGRGMCRQDNGVNIGLRLIESCSLSGRARVRLLRSL